MTTSAPGATAPALPTARECRTRASLLLKALRGDDPAHGRAAAERFRILSAFAGLEPERLVERRDRVRRKHALAVIAAELGFDSWNALKAALVPALTMPELRIQITRRADGNSVLRCERADGSESWQKQEGKHAAFFPLHDLTHYAVESELGFRSGFYGLVADGWDIEETTGKGARGRLPPEALTVEHIVGSLDVERASRATSSAEDFNAQAAMFAADRKLPAPRPFTDEELNRVRARIRELFDEWFALADGHTLELSFDRTTGVVR